MDKGGSQTNGPNAKEISSVSLLNGVPNFLGWRWNLWQCAKPYILEMAYTICVKKKNVLASIKDCVDATNRVSVENTRTSKERLITIVNNSKDNRAEKTKQKKKIRNI